MNRTTGGGLPAGGEDKVALTVEVCLRPESQANPSAVKAATLAFLASLSSVRFADAALAPQPGSHPLLDAHAQSIRIVDVGDKLPAGKLLLQWDVAWTVSGCCCNCLLARCCSVVRL